jgi:hypothetical protein
MSLWNEIKPSAIQAQKPGLEKSLVINCGVFSEAENKF